jgi:hypothetical protein
VQSVWELMTDLERLGEWVSNHRGFPKAPPTEVNEGTTFQQTLAVAGTPFAVEWTAVEVNSPQRLSWEGEAASAVVLGHAEHEADDSLARLKQLAEG